MEMRPASRPRRDLNASTATTWPTASWVLVVSIPFSLTGTVLLKCTSTPLTQIEANPVMVPTMPVPPIPPLSSLMPVPPTPPATAPVPPMPPGRFVSGAPVPPTPPLSVPMPVPPMPPGVAPVPPVPPGAWITGTPIVLASFWLTQAGAACNATGSPRPRTRAVARIRRKLTVMA
ncbi:hypothetical protein AN403_5993 [Pseudomonas fluorescens]|uniref:Uncharacterized protein n=1 Tax=Pseudomonas fluorescens TaxID=294 RepID=A0A0P8X6Y0_PSEFL|nr:hypothetical protein AN403_5993 [Pseudomonas fluorescens]